MVLRVFEYLHDEYHISAAVRPSLLTASKWMPAWMKIRVISSANVGEWDFFS